jgi:signal peptidase I
MTHRILDGDNSKKSIWRWIFDKITYGANEINILAQNSGEVSIPLIRVDGENGYSVPYTLVRNKIGSLANREYVILIADKPYKILTPADFALDKVLLERFCPNSSSWKDFISKNHQNLTAGRNIGFTKTGNFIRSGRSLLHFEILPGDMLFVDKMTYNFRAPKVGECIIFRTDDVQDLAKAPKFFIKRLVGKPGDTLAIREGKLFANGKLLSATETIKKLNSKAGGYKNGYVAAKLLAEGMEFHVRDGNYFVLGDNSKESYDSRFWGTVPQKSVKGRPLIVFYPFNSRFGIHE